MRKNAPLTIIVLLIVVLVGWLFWVRGTRNGTASTGTNQDPISANEGGTPSPPKTGSLPIPSPRQLEALIERPSQVRNSMESKNTRIDFWGRVVDQSRQPLPAAVVMLRIREWHALFPAKGYSAHHKHRLVTDSNGTFSLLGARGDVLSIEGITKEGYVLSSRAVTSFDYTRGMIPDSNAPVTFSMWKRQTRQQLIEDSRLFGIEPDNRWYTLDLVQGVKHEGDTLPGDLLVRIRRPAGAVTGTTYAWEYELKGLDGGLAPVQTEFSYLAPENGYELRFAQIMVPGDGNWSPLARQEYFIRSRGTNFGRIATQVFSDYAGKAAIRVDYTLNPSGSRILE